MNAVKAGSVVVLLLGGLLGTLGGVPWVAVGGVATVALIVSTMVHDGPHRVLFIVIMIMLVGVASARLAIAASASSVPPFEYRDVKIAALLTTTPLSAMAAVLVRRTNSITSFAHSWLIVMVPLAVLASASAAGDVRSEVFGANPVWAGRAMAGALIVTAWLGLARGGGLRKGLLFLLACLMLAGLFATGSRGPALGATVGIVLVLFVRPQPLGNRLVRFLATASVVAAAAITIPGLMSSRVVTTVTGGVVDNNADLRLDAWSATLRMIADNPFGVGLGNWYAIVPNYGFRPDDSLPYPHNLPLEVFAELGWIAGTLLMCTSLIALRRVWRGSRSGGRPELLVLALFACESISVCFSGDMTGRVWWFFLMLALIVEPKCAPDSNRGALPVV